MFGSGKKRDDLDDAALIRAARQRLLRELKSQHGSQSAQQRIINNVYGGGGGGGGLADRLGASDAGGDDPYDYLVNIERKNTPDGWQKTVRRTREEKKKA